MSILASDTPEHRGPAVDHNEATHTTVKAKARVAQAPVGRLSGFKAPGASHWRRQLRLFFANSLSVAGLVTIVLLGVIAIVGPYIVPYPEDTQRAVHIERALQPPSLDHLFGTDDVGRDVFSRVIVGTRLSLSVGIVVIVAAVLIGVPLGAIAGYYGGAINDVIMRITDVFLTIPALLLALTIAAALGPNLRNAMIALAIVWWPGFCRLTAGQMLTLRHREYVEAARVSGAKSSRIIFRHILPNAATPIMVKASLDVGFAILVAAGLSFVGVGAQEPQPEWGAMVSLGRRVLPDWWWYSTFPGLAIFITVLAFNLLGDGLRDVLDPRGNR